MEINFKGPVMPIDPYSQLAFVEILNIILTAGHIVDVNPFYPSSEGTSTPGSAPCQAISGGRSPKTALRSGNVRTTTPRCVSATGYWTCPSVSWPQKTTGKKRNS